MPGESQMPLTSTRGLSEGLQYSSDVYFARYVMGCNQHRLFFRMEGSLNSISGLMFISFQVSQPSLILVLQAKAEFKPGKEHGGALFE